MQQEKIKDVIRQRANSWSLIYDGQQYYVQTDQCSSKVDVYIYNDVVGGYEQADSIISRQIVEQLDIQSMLDQE